MIYVGRIYLYWCCNCWIEVGCCCLEYMEMNKAEQPVFLDRASRTTRGKRYNWISLYVFFRMLNVYFSLCENVVPKFVEILRWWTAGSVRVLGFVATSEWITSEVLENVIVRSCDGIEMWFRVVGVVAYHNVVGVVWYIELVTIFICFCHYRLPDINIECDEHVLCCSLQTQKRVFPY